MLYVLKYIGAGPDYFMEHFYDETVVVKNHVALVNMEHNMHQLLGRQFELIGTVENESGLKQLFEQKDTEVKPVTKLMQLKDILPEDKPVIEGAQRSWYENVE